MEFQDEIAEDRFQEDFVNNSKKFVNEFYKRNDRYYAEEMQSDMHNGKIIKNLWIFYQTDPVANKEYVQSKFKDFIPSLLESIEGYYSDYLNLVGVIAEFGNNADKDRVVEIINRDGDEGNFEILVKLMTSKTLDARNLAKTFLIPHLEEYGLDGQKLFDTWTKGYVDSNTLYRDLDNIVTLEKYHPGAAKILNEKFNVVYFGRYNLNLLEDMYKNIDDAERPYGLIINPIDDWNGAFYNDEFTVKYSGGGQGVNERVYKSGQALG